MKWRRLIEKHIFIELKKVILFNFKQFQHAIGTLLTVVKCLFFYVNGIISSF